MLRSERATTSGAILVFACYAAMLIVMPRFSPITLLHCFFSSSGDPPRSICETGLNPAYPLVFVLSIAGTVLFFFGVFGWSFVANRLFVIGALALEYGLAGMVASALGSSYGIFASPATTFVPLVLIGAVVLGYHASRFLKMPRPAPKGPQLTR